MPYTIQTALGGRTLKLPLFPWGSQFLLRKCILTSPGAGSPPHRHSRVLPLLEESEVPLQKEIGGCVFEQCQGTESSRSLCLAQVFRDSEHGSGL